MNKTELAIATDFGGESAKLEDIENTLKKISDAGFTHIHWCHEWDGDYIYSSYEMEQIKEWMDKYKLKAKALHASKGSRRNVAAVMGHYQKDYTSDWEFNRKAGVELIKNRVDLARIIGASEIVLHLYVPHHTINRNPQLKDKFYSQVFKSFDELLPYCKEKGVRICLENLFDIPNEYMIEQFDILMARYPDDFLGICIDTGHAFMSWRDDFTDIIERYKDRIYAVHIHDNNSSNDAHFIPEEGKINWRKTMHVLSNSAYKLPLTLEVTTQLNDIEQFLREAYIAGEKLTSYFNE